MKMYERVIELQGKGFSELSSRRGVKVFVNNNLETITIKSKDNVIISENSDNSKLSKGTKTLLSELEYLINNRGWDFKRALGSLLF
jgi:hypothetical protein